MKKIKVAAANEVQEAQIHAARADGQAILLTRVGGKVHAVSAKCTHLGLSMKGGKVADGAIQCPWHGSKFDLATGKNIQWTNSFLGLPLPKCVHSLIAMGKQPTALPVFAATEEDGAIYVELPG